MLQEIGVDTASFIRAAIISLAVVALLSVFTTLVFGVKRRVLGANWCASSLAFRCSVTYFLGGSICWYVGSPDRAELLSSCLFVMSISAASDDLKFLFSALKNFKLKP